jgi:putative ABC transport system permease protein
MKRSLRSWLWRVPVDQEVDEELAFHLEMRTRELVERGVDPAAAREQAMARLGDVARLKRTCVDLGRKRDREMRLTQWIEELRHDVKFAVRQLLHAPAFTLVAAITLALGIGANSAIFALVDATLLRPLPFPEPDRLVMVWERSDTSPHSLASPLNMLDWIDRSGTFERMAGFMPGVGGMVMNGRDGTAETVPRQWVTQGFFDVLGIKAIAGRTFLPSDESQRSRVVVLSEAFWRSRFDADRSVIGREIRLDGEQYTVVGVVPKEFQLFGRTSMWAMVPLGRRPALRTVYVLRVVGRMKPGVTLSAANADMTSIAEGLTREFPATNKGRGVTIEALHHAVIGRDLRLTSVLFVGVVGFVLLLCCANVANLLLARATARTRELAIRSALGAGRLRIIRQLLTESLALSALGGMLGVAIGAAILRVAPSLVPEGLLPAAVTLSFDMRVVAFCAATALVVGLLFGLAPAWQATELSSAQVMASESRTTTGRAGRIGGVLVAGEVAAAVLLLFGAGLLLRTLLAVEQVDRGYRADRVLTMMVDPLGSSYPTPAKLLQFYDSVEQEIRAVPGVRSVGWTTALPLGPSDNDSYSFEIAGDPPPDESRRPTVEYQIVSATYFRTLDVPIVAGRSFNDRDTLDSPAVCMVNEAFVRNHLRDRSPLGLRVALRLADSPQAKPVVREIVGVARQVKGRPDEAEDLVQLYVPMAQAPIDDIYLVVRPGSGRAEALAPSVRAAIGRVDKEQLVSVRNVMTLEDVAWEATARHRFRAVMVMTFAALALVLAMVGVFGILAYTVQQRVRDFAVRRALGATTGDVLRLVVGSATRVITSGVIVGLILSAMLSRLITTMLFGVQPLDLLTFASVMIVLALTAAVSIVGPAWRASRIDPAAALRSE